MTSRLLFSKTKGYYFRIFIKQFKNFLHKISQIGKTNLQIFKIIIDFVVLLK